MGRMSAPRQPLSPPQPSADARPLVEAILDEAAQRRASDVHVEPTAAGYEVRYRVDGLLETVARHDAAAGRSVVGRLMVMAHLLTYRLDVPQEGRISTLLPTLGATGPVELRLAVMPTTHGLRAAVRMPAELVQPRSLGELGLPPTVLEGLHRFAGADSGMLIVTGPAGSGKTTIIYALLEHIARTSPGVSVIALEDPVERDLPGVTQIEVSPFGELTYERSLRSILRQDPQVLALGEIRDAATASLALQAALSGHRLVCTLHAASPGGAIARLFEMGMEPYQITSALFGVLAQRLLRKRRDGGGAGSTYRGRVPAAELALMDTPLREAVLRRADAETLAQIIARQAGHIGLRQSAEALMAAGLTDESELARALGPRSAPEGNGGS
jgi:type II secretory ATPase GspE/PulE/Tfp pilus assembly ATPase PilB-like protein